MRIALCDDEKAYHETLQSLIREYKLMKPELPLSLHCFCSGRELLNNVDEHGGFDIYILDCIMPGLDGIETGCALRERSDNGIIIYLTTSPDFAIDSYQAEAFNYLLKPVDKDKFFHTMDKAFNACLRRSNEVISVKTSDSLCVIPVSDIRYAERTGKQVTYHLSGSKIIRSATFNSSFCTAVSELLSHKEMLLVGSSFVVNLSHVTEIKKYNLSLTGNIQVPVPQRLYESVKAEWADFWLNRGCHAF